MKNYEKPVMLAADGLSEGVYTASGAAPNDDSGDCWTINWQSDQDWNGWGHTFRLIGTHSTDVVHISTASTMTVVFNANITQVETEGEYSIQGNKVIITRRNHANAYNSGDNFNILLAASAGDEGLTKGLTITDITISCEKKENVQGGFD